jgi:hypothetical protein
MKTRVTSRQVRRIVNRDPNARIPLTKRVRKLEERLDETQKEVLEVCESQKRSEASLAKLSIEMVGMSERSAIQYEELRSLMSQVLSRVAQSIQIAEQAFHWRCSDCPQRPKPPAIGIQLIK